MTLGEKIKSARVERRMTQSALCGEKITRNMLSAIECGKATPSLDTLTYIAKRLSLPASYLVSDEDGMFFYTKRAAIDEIKENLKNQKYKAVIDKINSLGEVDDELSYILALSHFELGRKSVISGSLASGAKHLELALRSAEQTIYDTVRIRHSALIYSALAKNIKAPLLVLDIEKFEESILGEFDYDLFKYICSAEDHRYRSALFAKHVEAKKLIKERNYQKALAYLKEIEEERTPDSYNAYTVLGVYTDMENCYKQLADFENAYRYSKKQLTLIDAFKS